MLIVLLIFIAGFAVFQYGKMLEDNESITVARDHPMMQYFAEVNSYEIQAAALADITDDGVDDLLVIWRNAEEDLNYMAAVTEGNGEYALTGAEKAPYENLTIEFKDIDEKSVLEFIVSGSRLGNYGYGIYRVEEDAVVNIFGEGLDEC